MRKAAFFLLFTGISVITLAQTTPDTLVYKQASDGSFYKKFPAGGARLQAGNFMEMNVMVKYQDSLMGSSIEDNMPQYALYDTANFPRPYKEIFTNIHVGDSIILRISTDSILAKGQGAPFIKPGQFIYQHYTITNVFTTKEQSDSVQKTHEAVAIAKAEKKQQEQLAQLLVDNKDQIIKDSKTIEAYLAKNKLKAIKAKWGTYVVIKKAGTGRKYMPGDGVAVKYTGRSFATKKAFDSNTDPAFKHVQPYTVKMGQLGTIILGWNDALSEMKDGSVATIYVPSSLAWGSQGVPPDIQPDEIVVFDMSTSLVKDEEVKPGEQTDVKTTKPVKKAPAAKTKTVAKPKTKTTIKKAGK